MASFLWEEKAVGKTWRKFAFVFLCLIHIKYLKVLYFISCFRVKNEATVHDCQRADESRITAALCPVMWRVVNELQWRLLEFDSSDSVIHTKAKLPSTTCTGRASHLDTFKMSLQNVKQAIIAKKYAVNKSEVWICNK